MMDCDGVPTSYRAQVEYLKLTGLNTIRRHMYVPQACTLAMRWSRFQSSVQYLTSSYLTQVFTTGREGLRAVFS